MNIKLKIKIDINICSFSKDDLESENGLILRYTCSKTNFSIRSMWDEKWGGIQYKGLMLPAMDKIGVTYTKVFDDDMERYMYLKRLYITIDSWANFWYGFSYDSNSDVEVKDNIWTVKCQTAYNGPMDLLEYYDDFY